VCLCLFFEWSLENEQVSVSGLHVSQALRIASRGLRVLLVLDDVWESSFAEPFNVLDPTSTSRLLVTSRIRGLFSSKIAIEVSNYMTEFWVLNSSLSLSHQNL